MPDHRHWQTADFRAARPWGAELVAAIDAPPGRAVTTRLHWTDAPYHWHVNDGDELMVILHGKLEMRVRRDGEERSYQLAAGDLFQALEGCEHRALPQGEVRLLVIEREGSV